jgi:glycine oxidase
MYPAFVAELQAETGLPIDYQQHGAIETAATEEDWVELLQRAKKQKPLGIPSELAGDGNALFYPEDAAVDPRDVTRALISACRARQVTVLEGMPATGIYAGQGSVTVDTPGGRIGAELAVLAAGAWSGAIPFTAAGKPQRLPGSFPVRGHLLGYRLEPGTCPSILRRGNTYILQRANGFTIAGSSTENVGFDRTIRPDIVEAIAARAEELLPQLRSAGTPEPWIGFRPRADAHKPQIRRFEDSPLWLAYGHYRNGILLAPATAERVAG